MLASTHGHLQALYFILVDFFRKFFHHYNAIFLRIRLKTSSDFFRSFVYFHKHSWDIINILRSWRNMNLRFTQPDTTLSRDLNLIAGFVMTSAVLENILASINDFPIVPRTQDSKTRIADKLLLLLAHFDLNFSYCRRSFNHCERAAECHSIGSLLHPFP